MKAQESKALTSVSPQTLARAREHVARAADYAAARTTENTKKTYTKWWKAFCEWAVVYNADTLPALPVTIVSYLGWMAAEGFSLSTIQLTHAAIGWHHKEAGFRKYMQDDVIHAEMEGIANRLGFLKKKKRALRAEQLKRIVKKLPSSVYGRRARAILLIGFAGAFRRNELVLMKYEDFKFLPEGLLVLLPRSKTDQQGKGRFVGIPYAADEELCPVKALLAYLAGRTSGCVFNIDGNSIARIIKRAVASIGLKSEDFSGHSMRAGFVTEGRAQGMLTHELMQQTGHTGEKQLNEYFREEQAFAGRLGKGLL